MHVRCDFFVLRRKTSWLARISDEYRRSQNCHKDKALVDRVFSTGITSYQIILLQFARWFCIYIHISTVTQEINIFNFFSHGLHLRLYSSNWLIVDLGKSNTLEINCIMLFCIDDQSFRDWLPWAWLEII